ncbi:hypothetical protein ACFWBX_08985 [Streptomyces sp. NPDC059991]|uniref:hypothetical protein n=1 Tax=Streptomyces sp. NPDC059991 TaxID=3347028 RepID=UPI00368663AB
MSAHGMFCVGQTATHTPTGSTTVVTKPNPAGSNDSVRVRFEGTTRSRVVPASELHPHPTILIYRHYFHPEHAVEGDIAPVARINGRLVRSYTRSETDCTPDTDAQAEDSTAVDNAVEYLQDHDLTEPSGHSSFTHVDGSTIENHYTGQRCAPSAHLYGFTHEQSAEIQRRLQNAR